MSVIGLDVGTSRIKAVRFDAEWQAVDLAGEPSVVRRGPHGLSEQDMPAVWGTARRVLAVVAHRSPDPVELVSITAQGDGCWLVDQRAEPVRPAMLWNDGRAAPQIAAWQRDGVLAQAFAVNGCLGAPGNAHAQLRWLRDHEPEALSRAATLLSCGSWVYRKLTGRQVLESSDAANPFLDARSGRYDTSLLELFGIAELGRLLPPIVAGADRVAPLLTQCSASLGLPAGTPITLAPYDVPATAIGTGAIGDDRAFAILGTTLCVGSAGQRPRLDRVPTGITLPGPRAGQWLIAYPTMVGTEVLDWTATILGVGDAARVAQLAATARRDDVPLVLPYLSPAGERSPFLDSSVRGAIHGLDTNHTPADVARGVLDGLTLCVLDCALAAGARSSLALCGGGAASDLWCQSICDAVGLPAVRPEVAEVGALGAVLCGATDAGLFVDLDQALAHGLRPGRVFEPEPRRTDYYRAAYERFLAARSRQR